MDIDALKRLVDDAINQWAAGVSPTTDGEEITEVKNTERVLPEGQRVVRTKTSGDRVYLLDDKDTSRRWVTNGDILKALGFEFTDVVDVSDEEMAKYNMGPAIYKLESTDAANGPA